jgi:hypothetical protein
MVATGWFMCIYISFLPWEICLRILDNFFCLNTNIVFHVALALFVLNEQKLMDTKELEHFLLILNRSTYQAEGNNPTHRLPCTSWRTVASQRNQSTLATQTLMLVSAAIVTVSCEL